MPIAISGIGNNLGLKKCLTFATGEVGLTTGRPWHGHLGRGLASFMFWFSSAR
jgi:hypothetical protein